MIEFKYIEEHHIWCNDFMHPRKDCKMCESLYHEYPLEGLNEEELMAKHFSRNIIIK